MDIQNQRIINIIIFMGTVLIFFIYYFMFNLSINVGYKLIGVIIILPLIFAMLKSRKLLIFSTLFFLMLTATDINYIKTIMETLRWIPFIVFAFVFFLNLIKNKSLPREPEKFDLALGILILVMFLSAFYSIDPVMTLKRAGTFLLLYISIFWVVYPEINSEEEFEEVINLIIYSALIIYAIGFVILFFFPEIALHGNRFEGYLLNPNTVGILTAVLLPVVLWKALDKDSKLAKILLILMLISLFLSGSRSGLLGCLFGGGFYLYITRKKHAFAIIFLGLISMVSIFIAGDEIINKVFLYLRMVSLGDIINIGEINVISSGRIEKWNVMLSLLKRRPFTGYGFGTEDLLFRYFGIKFKEPGLYAHNTFLGMAVQIGVFGFLLFFSPLFYLLFSSKGAKSSLYYSLKGMMVGGLVVGFFETWIYSIGNAFVFPFWLGVIMLLRLNKS